ncbi:phosphopantetheine-binding protein [Streptococcus uberis]|uniref:phosphopantetheine-binding protein n=1 Tax=Streptococcus uberis TaxID=1349 RepID=UPI002150696E|nr:phosphopantetheine-binding protein [Streptococcus uberis]MCR4254229.1 phosphopantetheine-binding protein [Streptococcus uberis]MCR4256044.1 phosphopantetheine-binding protein [Streptococcus uberis]MCR4260704.1 phosphopantetheine-binding protein [Streptococcus uberis]MCR4263061.1 phosphopantetheine-binding protein [Streptococcus uberis]MCV6816859.1 phosphopantetheine-binding protein [Streptococcus uberis]
MTREDLLKRLEEIIKVQDPEKALLISEKTSLKDDLGVDSIELMEFVINVEDAFSISIPDEDVETLMTIGDLIDYLQKKLAK